MNAGAHAPALRSNNLRPAISFAIAGPIPGAVNFRSLFLPPIKIQQPLIFRLAPHATLPPASSNNLEGSIAPS